MARAQKLHSIKGQQVALEDNFRFLLDKSDLKSASDKLQSDLRTISVKKTSRHAVSAARFPAKPPLLAVFIHKTATRGISKYVTKKNSCYNFFLFFPGSSWRLCYTSPVKSFLKQNTLAFVFQDLSQFGLLGGSRRHL